MTIPLVDVHSQYEPLIPELEARFREVLDGGQFIRGPHFYAFQEEAAAYLGVKQAVGVANGTDALVLALDALEIGPGDEVICPAFTFYATAESIARRGATPVFADIDPMTLNIDPRGRRREDHRPDARDHAGASLRPPGAARRAARSSASRSIEDAAQAFGAPGVAQLGRDLDLQLLPDEEPLLPRRRRPRRHRTTRRSPSACACSRSTARATRSTSTSSATTRASTSCRPAFLRIFLTHLDEWNRGRREAAARYAELGLGDLVDLPQDEPGHIYHLFVCRSPERDRIRAALVEAGIGTATYYVTPLHLQPALRFLGYEPGSLPETERVAQENFSVPLWPGMPVEAQERVVDVVRSAVGVAARHDRLRASPPVPAPRRRGIVALSWFLAFQLRFDQGLPVYYDTLLRRTILLVVAIKMAVFLLFGFHRRWWRYVSVHDMWSAARGVVVASLLAYVTVYFVSPVHNVRLPRSIAAMDLLITLALIAGARLVRAHRDRAAALAASSRTAAK